MGEERIELEKLNIVLFQSLAVLFSAYIVSLFKDAEYTFADNCHSLSLAFCILLQLAILPIVFIAEAI